MKYKDTNSEMQELKDENKNSMKNNPELDIDDEKMKAHLNASFDFSSIQVSEELINRTMSAIKEQSEHTNNKKETVIQPHNKGISFQRSIRGIAGVAAAILLITVGINVMKQNTLMKSDEAAPSNDIAQYDMVTEESAEVEMSQKYSSESAKSEAAGTMQAEDSVGIASVENPEASITYRYSVTADIMDNGSSEGETSDTTTDQVGYGTQDSNTQEEAGISEKGAPASEQQTMIAKDDTSQFGIEKDQLSDASKAKTAPRMALAAGEPVQDQAQLSFRDIFLADPSQAEYLTITDEVNNISITLTSQDEINEFYAMMEQQQYILQTQKETPTPGINTNNYEVQIKNPNPNALYTLIIGDNLIVRYLVGGNITEKIYLTKDEALFLTNFETFFKQHLK